MSDVATLKVFHHHSGGRVCVYRPIPPSNRVTWCSRSELNGHWMPCANPHPQQHVITVPAAVIEDRLAEVETAHGTTIIDLADARNTIARGKALASEWLASCPGEAGKHRLCKGGQLLEALGQVDTHG